MLQGFLVALVATLIYMESRIGGQHLSLIHIFSFKCWSASAPVVSVICLKKRSRQRRV